MHIEVKRIWRDAETTVGKMSINGEFFCFTLEDTDRFDGEKVYGETAIPAGDYVVKLKEHSRLLDRYVKRFGAEHEAGMLEICDVPNFSGVLIHCGNNQKHTEGCLLVGDTAHLTADESTIGASRKAYRRLYPIIRGELLAGRYVYLTIG